MRLLVSNPSYFSLAYPVRRVGGANPFRLPSSPLSSVTSHSFHILPALQSAPSGGLGKARLSNGFSCLRCQKARFYCVWQMLSLPTVYNYSAPRPITNSLAMRWKKGWLSAYWGHSPFKAYMHYKGHLLCLFSWWRRKIADQFQLRLKTNWSCMIIYLMVYERRRKEGDGKDSASDAHGAAASCRTSAGRAVRLADDDLLCQ